MCSCNPGACCPSPAQVKVTCCSCPVRCVKSRELIGGVLLVGCDCPKRNGLQDDCPRRGCGIPECLCQPDPCCLPAKCYAISVRRNAGCGAPPTCCRPKPYCPPPPKPYCPPPVPSPCGSPC